jgi:Zinc finger, C3HC4 type (RING finger)
VSPNSQATYLHIVRLGAAPAASTPDIRPWVVRVVKREATIGPHTFHLHEIYGLTSHSSPTSQSVTNLQADPHVYPPTAGAAEDDPTSECLLCLSSPREVVLLPCRHLVACKECAVNMVEFGAGGQLVHGDEAANAGDTNANAAGATTAEAPGEGSGANEGEATPAPAPVTPQVTRTINPRRKRKAKGWFCPVCRQPYTSLLRISTTAPSVKAKVVGEGEGEGEEDAAQVSTTPVAPTLGAPGQQGAGAGTQTQRPGFLRAISNAAARVTGSDNSNNSTGNGNNNARGNTASA